MTGWIASSAAGVLPSWSRCSVAMDWLAALRHARVGFQPLLHVRRIGAFGVSFDELPISFARGFCVAVLPLEIGERDARRDVVGVRRQRLSKVRGGGVWGAAQKLDFAHPRQSFAVVRREHEHAPIEAFGVS